MATPLVFHHENSETSCHLRKVDRSKLYGYVEKLVVDEDAQICELATLAADGQTLIGSGGSAFAYFDPDGVWCDKAELTAVDLEGKPVHPVPSSYKAPIVLDDTATVEEYLSHNIRSVYTLDVPEGFADSLTKALAEGTIFTFPFSYRGGLSPDSGFLLQGHDGNIWLALGKPTEIRFVGLSEITVPDLDSSDENDDENNDDAMDFGFM